ncbi:hypothetical protein E2C01_028034 [Portunus trituberculatus]|uniref:Uncharacterized protein n=1 Tax=Portunus trituberculatus TaxID=210409 RepID=A0A5B7EMU3_PORTR|nr:hypothetical protein [Portunus trituberculatus]
MRDLLRPSLSPPRTILSPPRFSSHLASPRLVLWCRVVMCRVSCECVPRVPATLCAVLMSLRAFLMQRFRKS